MGGIAGRPRAAGDVGRRGRYVLTARRTLITELSKLPGIGRRTAQRLAFHILRVDEEEGLALADAIREVKEKIGFCEICFNLTDQPICKICSDERRDKGLICVVEEPGDIIPVERTNEFHGLYHVLGGSLSPIDGDRAGRPDDQPADWPRVRSDRPRGRARDQPDDHRRSDGALHRRRARAQATRNSP